MCKFTHSNHIITNSQCITIQKNCDYESIKFKKRSSFKTRIECKKIYLATTLRIDSRIRNNTVRCNLN